jgi:hypothetical protein
MNALPKTILFLAALTLSGAAFAQAPAAPGAAPAAGAGKAATPGVPQNAAAPKLLKDTGLAGSQSIRYDLFYDRYIVANDGAAGAGYITTITGDGKVDQLKFIAGGQNGADLTDPAGIYVRNGVLYVADKTKGVRVFDLVSGKQTAKYDIPGAISLHSIAVTANGAIFVSDSGKTDADGAIYKITTPDGKVTKIASGASTKRPAGIDINVNRLDKPGGTATIAYVTSDGSDIVLIDEQGTEITRTNLNIGKLASIAYTDDGYILVDTQDGAVYVLDPYWHPLKMFDGITGAAGIGWDWVRGKTLIAQPASGVVIGPGPIVPGYPGG